MKYKVIIMLFTLVLFLFKCGGKKNEKSLLYFEHILAPDQDTISERYMLKLLRDSLSNVKFIINSDSEFVFQNIINKQSKFVYKRLTQYKAPYSFKYQLLNVLTGEKDTVAVFYIQPKADYVFLDFVEPYRRQRVFVAHRRYEIKK
jgi:hypothetical protein